MIGRLAGLVLECTPGLVLLDVNGVGYELEISLRTFSRMSESEGPVVLYTHLAVREDAQSLYGFATVEEQKLFRTLIGVKGVGPRLALTLLSGLDARAFAEAVLNKDVGCLTALPGVGRKTAEQLIFDFRDKVDALGVSSAEIPGKMSSSVTDDAETALVGLGYRPQEVSRVIARIENPADEVEALIRQTLKLLMQK